MSVAHGVAAERAVGQRQNTVGVDEPIVVDAAAVLGGVAAQRALHDVVEVIVDSAAARSEVEDAAAKPAGRVRLQRRVV